MAMKKAVYGITEFFDQKYFPYEWLQINLQEKKNPWLCFWIFYSFQIYFVCFDWCKFQVQGIQIPVCITCFLVICIFSEGSNQIRYRDQQKKLNRIWKKKQFSLNFKCAMCELKYGKSEFTDRVKSLFFFLIYWICYFCDLVHFCSDTDLTFSKKV